MLNLILFLFEAALPESRLEAFLQTFAVVPRELLGSLQAGSWQNLYPLVTSAFLHGGWLHLGGNLLFLYIFGDNVEDRMGHARFAVFYLLCAIASALGQALSAPDSAIPILGASGAIAGVLGAYFLYYRHARITTLVFLGFFVTSARIPAAAYLVIWFLIQAVSGVTSQMAGATGGGVAWWAHTGGFVAGLLLAPVFAWGSRDDRKRHADWYERYYDRWR